ncbi:MAG: hypothetical protein ABWZ03_05345, partial [Solirubrobacterales bacterium]
IRDGAQQASEIAYDLRDGFNVTGLLKQAGVEGAMAYLGGVTQNAFNGALTARFGARLTDLVGEVAAQRTISAVGAATSSFYTAPATRVLNRILNGGQLPQSLEQLADMIAEEALQSAALDLGIGIITSKAHARPATPDGTPAPPRHTPDAPHPVGTHSVDASSWVPGTQTPETHVFELAGRVVKENAGHLELLGKLGSWEQAIGHLRRATGPAHGMEESLRATLIQKLSDHRSALVTQIAEQFGAKPAGKPSNEPESDLDLNVAGEKAGEQAVRIKLFMDANHPGWQKLYRMAVMVDAGRLGTVNDALAKLPVATRTEIARRQALTAEAIQLMRMARNTEHPGQRQEILNRIGDTQLRERAEEYANLVKDQPDQMHNRLLAETDRKVKLAEVSPDAHTIEDALTTQMWANALDGEAYVSRGAIDTIVLGKPLEAKQAYEAVLDQVGMIHHLAKEAGGMRAALRRYETFKYIKRICDHLLASGVKDPRLTMLRNQAELAYNVERRASASAEGRVLTAKDLTSTAHTRDVHHDDLGDTAGVSDAFLAETHRMLDAVLTERLPSLRRTALGEADGGAPVTIPALGPEVTPKTSVPHVGDPEAGLLAPDSLDRISESALRGTAPPEGATVLTQAKTFFPAIETELQRIGVRPPRIDVRDMGNPSIKGRFDLVTNTITINEGHATKDGKLVFDGTPLGHERLRMLLMHESRHAEQWFQAMRFKLQTERDPAKLQQQTGAHMDIINAALKAPPLVPGSREHAQAQTWHEEFWGQHAAQSARGQGAPELQTFMRIAEHQAQMTDAALGRVRWFQIYEKFRLKSKLAKIQGELTRYKADLDDRMAIYWNLLHERDARTAEKLAAQAIGSKQLARAARRHAEAKAELDFLRETVPDREHQAQVTELAAALDAYGEALLNVGRNYTQSEVD